MKTKIIIYALIAIALTATSLATVNFASKYEEQKQENEKLSGQLSELTTSYTDLSISVMELGKQKTYAITLAPNVNSKISAVFGSAKQLTLQYYFSMDGNKMELFPDSVYQVNRLE